MSTHSEPGTVLSTFTIHLQHSWHLYNVSIIFILQMRKQPQRSQKTCLRLHVKQKSTCASCIVWLHSPYSFQTHVAILRDRRPEPIVWVAYLSLAVMLHLCGSIFPSVKWAVNQILNSNQTQDPVSKPAEHLVAMNCNTWQIIFYSTQMEDTKKHFLSGKIVKHIKC